MFGKGTFVGGRPQSVQSCAEALGADPNVEQLLEARTLIEPQAARLAIEVGTIRPWLISDTGPAQRCRRLGRPGIDGELFHSSVVEARQRPYHQSC